MTCAWCDDSQNTSDSDVRARAAGLERKMNYFNFMYGLRLSMLVLTHSDNLSATLQTPNICAADAQKTANMVIDTLQKLRTDERAQNFFDLVKKESVRLGIDEPEPCLPRRKKALRRMDDYFGYGSSTPHHHDTAASHYLAIYFAAISMVTSTIKDRFDQPDYRVYVNLEETLLNGANGKNFEDTMTFLEKNYQNEIDFVQLKIQLESLSCSFKDHSSNDASLGDVVNHLRFLTQGQRLLLDQIMKLAQ